MRPPLVICLLLWLCGPLVEQRASAIAWLALAQPGLSWEGPATCRAARSLQGLSLRQSRACRRASHIMPHVWAAAGAAVVACQEAMEGRRWNCSSVAKAPHYMADLTAGTREQAYVYALSAAALAHSLSHACSLGSVSQCSCAPLPRDPPDGHFQWGGCGDNLRWGSRFARRWEHLGLSAAHTGVPMDINRHNSRAGRRALQASVSRHCKCHGVSGSCSMRTCWKALPPLASVAARLRTRFDAAIEVSPRGWRGRDGPGPAHLVYVTKSPDYCVSDPRVGSVGTHGRRCHPRSPGPDSCHQLCCGRGHHTLSQVVHERCHCQYHWCCYVRCTTCARTLLVHLCY